MTDADTRAAITALAYRLRKRDAALRGDGDGEEAADPDVFALEFMTAMLGKGWQVVKAKVIPIDRPARVDPDGKTAAELLAEARAACEQATEAQHAAVKARTTDGAA